MLAFARLYFIRNRKNIFNRTEGQHFLQHLKKLVSMLLFFMKFIKNIFIVLGCSVFVCFNLCAKQQTKKIIVLDAEKNSSENTTALNEPAANQTIINRYRPMAQRPMANKTEKIIAKGMTENECYRKMLKACSDKRWNDAIFCGDCLKDYRPKKVTGKEALYFLGISYFAKNSLEKANDCFSEYLNTSFMPRYFEEALTYKFKIARKYQQGIGKPLFGLEKMPNWIPAEEDALKIYDELINALPQTDMMIQATYNKALLHMSFKDYKDAIGAFESLIEKYPKHELAIQSYLLISKSYLYQADPKHHEHDLLHLAKLNLEKFEKSFPLEEKVIEMKKDIRKMEEIYAQGFFEVAQFYHKKKAFNAVELYCNKIKRDFPHTKTAQKTKLLKPKA